VVINVVAEEKSLTDDTAAHLDGEEPLPSTALPERTLAEALAPPPPTAQSPCNPAVIIGAAIIPAPLLAATLAGTATIRYIVHPGNRPPESGYVPSAGLARFIRCRDLTCRFPGCDQPADACDIDHTIAYPHGPTQASNLKCLCRKHHLLKTFWDWRDHQLPDATIIWTSPGAQTYTTHPGSRLLFPTLCTPTAPIAKVNAPAAPPANPNKALMMPRRTTTRTHNRTQRIQAQRRLNDPHIAERNKPPPF
jgi:hypothetical protein